MLELHRASKHSHPVKGSATGSVSKARARQSINTLTPWQGIGNGSARRELDIASTHSQTVKGSAMGSVSEARTRQSINTLTPYQSISEARACQIINILTGFRGISDGFGQLGSSSTEHEHTHTLPRDQRRVRDRRQVLSMRLELDRASTHSHTRCVRSARLEPDRVSTHSHTVKGSAMHSVSEARARQSINTFTY
ncbi:hypothetical protein DFJ58DRAFT_761722, partial [Suillus subalutaceus]|uniref:uncharacterized protein n=1 Tax=Suillus subalutaceus TaxID=48586 RepID=UPI001B874FDE